MPNGDADIFMNVVFDVKTAQGAKAVDARINKYTSALTKNVQVVNENGNKFQRVTYITRGTEAQIDKVIQKASKLNTVISATKSPTNPKTIDWYSKLRQNSFAYEVKYNNQQNVLDKKRQEFHDNLVRNSFQNEINYYNKLQKDKTASANALARLDSTQSRHRRFNYNDIGIITKNLTPQAAENINKVARSSSKLYDMTEGINRFAGSLHKVSMAALAANMSALGLYFSMYSFINLAKQGLTSLFNPLSDIGTMFEQIAMSQAFGSGVGFNSDKMVEAWEKFAGLKADVSSTLMNLGVNVLTDPQVWDAISTGVKAFMDELNKPDTISAIKSVIIALANTLPAIARMLPDIANFVKTIAPYIEVLLPLAIKAAIVMPFLSIATGIASMAAALATGVGGVLRFIAAYRQLGALNAIKKTIGIEIAESAGAGAAAGAGGGLLGGLLTKLSDVWTTIKSKLTKFKTEKLIPALTKIIDSLPEELSTALKTAGSKIATIFADGIVSSLCSALKFALGKIAIPISILSLVEPVGKGGDELDWSKYGINSTDPAPQNYNMTRLKQYATGGYIENSGLAYVHRGEYVVSKDTVGSNQSKPSTVTQTFEINIYGNMTKDVNDDLVAKLRNASIYGGGV